MSNGVHLMTGHQATNHISAADEAAFMSAYVSGGNYVIADAQEITLTADTSAGSLSVDDFVALFSGRKVVASGATANYTKPSSGTAYRHVSAGILYTKTEVSGDMIEDCSFAVYTSSTDRSTESAAREDSTGAPATTEIGSATTEAYFELFDLIVTGSAVKTQTNVYQLAHTIPNIESAAIIARSVVYTGTTSGYDTSNRYYEFSESVADILASARIAIIKLWKHDNGAVPVHVIYHKSVNVEGSWYSIPIQQQINNTLMMIVYRTFAISSGTYVNQLAVYCTTTNSGSPVINAVDIPYDRATIILWR